MAKTTKEILAEAGQPDTVEVRDLDDAIRAYQADAQRLDDLLVYGSCDGDLPLCASANMARQTEQRDGRTYWVQPAGLKGRSLVEQLLAIQDAAARPSS